MSVRRQFFVIRS